MQIDYLQYYTKPAIGAICAILLLIGTYSPVQAQTLPTFGEPLWTVPAGSTTWLSSSGNHVRGVAINRATGNILVPSRADGIRIERINPTNGASLGTLNTSGIAGGLLPLNRVAVTEDGQIFAINLILESGSISSSGIGKTKMLYPERFMKANRPKATVMVMVLEFVEPAIM